LSPEVIILYPDEEVSSEIIEKFQQLIQRRLNNEPVAKIIGKKSFWKSDFLVNNFVLDPRPDTEIIIEAALTAFPDKDTPLEFLDLGTGSGCIILSLLQEFPNAIAVAIDISEDALNIAKANAKSHLLENRVSFLKQNWADSLNKKFDLIVSNPPYIPSKDIENLSDDVKNYDPMLALDGGIDGLEPYHYLAKQLVNLLKKDSFAILEFGQGQAPYIKYIFEQNGYKTHKILKDLNNIERAIIIKKRE
ncbi:MAG: peptide chain release factor N(5)-glutamine methyltransferase, partial [Pseudomonadota bacterium]